MALRLRITKQFAKDAADEIAWTMAAGLLILVMGWLFVVAAFSM